MGLLLYVVCACGITWGVWAPYLWAARTGETPPSPFLYYLAAAGPLAGALVAELVERGAGGVRALLAQILPAGQPIGWIAAGALSPLALVPVAVLLVGIAGYGWPAWDGFGISSRAPGLGLFSTWLLMTVSYGLGEETGWRGYLLPRLQARYGALVATLVLSVIWAFWHVPAFFFREGYTSLDAIGLVGFFVGLFAGAIVLTWLYNASRGSVLAVLLWHGSWNWVAMSDGLQGAWVAVMSTLIIAWAIVIVWRYGPAELCAGRCARFAAPALSRYPAKAVRAPGKSRRSAPGGKRSG
jgi:membrane protease YdiL (CAAX protease family)